MVRPYQGDRVQCPRGSYAKKFFVATVQFFLFKILCFWAITYNAAWWRYFELFEMAN